MSADDCAFKVCCEFHKTHYVRRTREGLGSKQHDWLSLIGIHFKCIALRDDKTENATRRYALMCMRVRKVVCIQHLLPLRLHQTRVTNSNAQVSTYKYPTIHKHTRTKRICAPPTADSAHAQVQTSTVAAITFSTAVSWFWCFLNRKPTIHCRHGHKQPPSCTASAYGNL